MFDSFEFGLERIDFGTPRFEFLDRFVAVFEFLDEALDGGIHNTVAVEGADCFVVAAQGESGVEILRHGTDVAAMEIAVPRDRQGSFEPLLIGKGQRLFEGFDEPTEGR